jgi:1-acyl-sn-glycerol-3-phosphate acyltransferase
VIAWTPLVLLFRAFTFPLDRNRLRVGRLFHSSAVIAGTINPFWSFRLSGADSVDARKPHVFVANHGSFTDVFLIVRLPWEMKWLSKEAIFRIPFLGWQMRAAGDVPVLRGDRDSSRRAMERMRRILESGVSVILFPEGTRSALGSLGEFRAGAFRLAIDAGADVVPLAISGAAQSLPKRSAVFRPATPTLAVLPAVSTVGWISDDAPRLAARVRLQIAEALGLGNASRRAVRIR